MNIFLILAAELAKIKFSKLRKKFTLTDVFKFASLFFCFCLFKGKNIFACLECCESPLIFENRLNCIKIINNSGLLKERCLILENYEENLQVIA